MWTFLVKQQATTLLAACLVLIACRPIREPAAVLTLPPTPEMAVTDTAVPTLAATPIPVSDTVTAAATAAPTAAPTHCVPVPPPGWAPYIVQPANTLFGLAWRGGTTVAELKRVNCREDDMLYIGEMLYTPPGSGYNVGQAPPVNVVVTLPPPPVVPPPPPPCQTPPCDDLPPLPTLSPPVK